MEGKKNVKPAQLNKFMHPRNPYKFVSFKELAIAYPEFRAHCTYDISGKVYLDFKNKKALKALTTVLLDRDYGLKVNIPEDRLIPTLPLRLNYLLWIEDLLALVQGRNTHAKESTVGFDIGTGAAAVYPFIGAKKNGWHFIATETDEVSYQSAKENINRNGLESSILLKNSGNFLDILNEQDVIDFVKRVKLKQGDCAPSNASEEGKEEASQSSEDKRPQGESYSIDFTMCNPPFFSSEDEMDPNHNNKKETRSQPVNAPTGSAHERVTEGGEIAFVTKIIDSSLQYKNQVRIFTTLIGKKHHVKPVLRLIQEKAEDSYVCLSDTEFCQGRTMRWGIAWTFDPDVQLQKVISKKQKLTQKPMVFSVPRTQMTVYSVQALWSKILIWLKDIKIKPHLIKSNKYFVGATIRAYKPTWLHQRQKRRKKLAQTTGKSPTKCENEDNPKKRKSEEDNEETSCKKSNSVPWEAYAMKCDPSSVVDQSEPEMDPEFPLKDVNTSTDEPSSNDLEPKKSTADPPIQSGLECLLKAWLTVKQTEALISVELKYLSGTGNKETVNQLLQYMRNRLQRAD